MEYKSRDLFGDFQQLLTLIERVEIISVPMFLLIPHEPWNGKKDARKEHQNDVSPFNPS